MVPDWLQRLAPLEWYERYGKRVEDLRLPRSQAAREAYAQTVGEDGFHLLDALERPEAPEDARVLPTIATLRRTWQRHYERGERPGSAAGDPPSLRVRFKANRELPRAAEGVESPYDTAWPFPFVPQDREHTPTAVQASVHTLQYVDDGSQDRTWELIEALSSNDRHIVGIKLSRNCGHQNALLAGLFTAPGDALISIDADLQDDVEAISRMDTLLKIAKRFSYAVVIASS